MKKKVLICLWMIVLVLVVLVGVFVSKTVKKMKIVEDIESKMEQYVGSDNYYIKTISHSGNRITVLEDYVKGDKELSKMTTEEEIIYYDNEDEEAVHVVPVWEYHFFGENYSRWDLFWAVAFSPIKEVEVNGIECYRIDNYNGVMKAAEGEYYYCVAKDTGLLMKTMLGDGREADGTRFPVYNVFEVKFDCVTDEDLVIPENLE